jgi:energy-coupling factor transporter ATP-binding protein EcfA2
MPYQLSGGQQQRVAIARSLITKPSIILADEPTGNLDSRSSHIIMEELRDIHSQGNTIIMVTHNPDLTAYATRVINMLDGSIDTDIKTVADHNLPTGNIVPEKISVRVLSRQKTPEIAVDSETPVIVSGKNITVEKTEVKPAKEDSKPRTLKKRELHNSPYSAKPATAKDAPKPDKDDEKPKLEPRKRRAVAKLSSLTKKLKSKKKTNDTKKKSKKAKKGKED